MSVTPGYFDSDALLEKCVTTEKQKLEAKIIRQLEAHINNVKAYEKQLDDAKKKLKDFQDKIDGCHTEEHAKTFCNTF